MEIADFKEIAPLLTGIITATAAILAVAVTSLFNLKVARINIEAQGKQKTKELRLERLEELYLLFDKWERNFTNIYLIYFRCYMGKLRYQETHELIQKQNILAPNEAQKYKMIMMVHFPSLAPAYEPVEAARKLLVPFLTDPSKSALSAREFDNLQKSFEKACETFKSEISSLAHITTGAEKHS
ncbi:hypothetical protein K7402_01035 [Pseudomonas fluorescens group sp.]|uniref:DUF4760 domain-containing protein n=2 Tax=Pseudomonas fluorescens TaxID=294 RepID=C3KCZ7_PSEFS|nr:MULTISPECIES: hypothetical protein [Pseudomonas fluorescens group]MBZ6454369.1 hypothetical protein [Pseudomonas fluorescens group sp.]MBZ6460354.1 hypothetical protein [Pseudomonas fluorescens group sp.]MBZ6465996.1 hypothetical protein [Pseudomonas fluorescens group sp.]WQD69710.1 hypothetical protein U0037_16710 [Pseudomonas marginalis]CAI2797558.1 Uncharacterized protein PFLU_3344 [Pseudomonas fluorescens SBW25]